MAQWLLLTNRCGKEIENPSHEDLRQAIDELGKEDPGEHHPSAWLRSETDEASPFYLLSVNRDGTVSFSKFMNHEADDPVVELTKKVPSEKAIELMTLLAEGKPERVKEELGESS